MLMSRLPDTHTRAHLHSSVNETLKCKCQANKIHLETPPQLYFKCRCSCIPLIHQISPIIVEILSGLSSIIVLSPRLRVPLFYAPGMETPTGTVCIKPSNFPAQNSHLVSCFWAGDTLHPSSQLWSCKYRTKCSNCFKVRSCLQIDN